jgi:hypothetical protein
MSPKQRRSSTSTATAAPVYQLKITLAEVEPSVWRRIRVRGDLSLDRLHAVFQRAMGWQDAHLHEWTVGGRRYGLPEPDEPHYEVEDESDLTLRRAAPIEGVRFEYVYDLGDSWAHEVVVERIDPPDPRSPSVECLAGGYEHFLDAIRDPRHPEHRDLLAWAGGRFEPEAFDLAAVNRRLRRLR